MKTKKLQILGNLGNKIYTQNEEPIGAADGSLWIDLSTDPVLQVKNNGIWEYVSGQSSTDEYAGVFVAIYGTTTNTEIEAALTEGKIVFCKNGVYNAVFLRKNTGATRHIFGYQASDKQGEYLCDNNKWSSSTVYFKHANSHGINGSDPITPDDIGAAENVHTHDDMYYTKEEIDTAIAAKTQVQIITWEADD